MTGENYPGCVETCPHPECGGRIRIPFSLPAGDYACPCGATELSVTWSTRADYRRVAHVELSAAAKGDRDA